MPEVTLSQFAREIGVSVERLQEQMRAVGLPQNTVDGVITDEDKARLLGYLRSRRGCIEPTLTERVTLKRRSTGEIKVLSPLQGRSRARTKTVSVEYRKKRAYTKPSVIEQPTQNPAQGLPEIAKEVSQGQVAEQEAISESRSTEPKMAEPTVEAIKTSPPEAEKRLVAEASVGEAVLKDTPEKPDDKRKNLRKKEKEKPAPYGRQELHVDLTKSRRRRQRAKPRPRVVSAIEPQHAFEKPTGPVIKEIELPQNITVGDLAQRMSIKVTEVIKMMMDLGSMVTINERLDQESAALVVEGMGHKVKLLEENSLEAQVVYAAKEGVEVSPRAPVVTVMGHVDHGKTSLLDYIRKSGVAKTEAGGITQHIGAYVANLDKGNRVVFLDTPGHAAFNSMRARGAKVTDLIVVVVAADDGVMPQTEEAVRHARAAEVPIIIAVNKIDKAEVDPEQIKQRLTELQVIPEEWGGDTQFVNISALTGEGVDSLLDSIVLQAELLELTAPIAGPATGTVIESRLDKGRGSVATVLVQGGALNRGDVVLSGGEFGRIRAMFDGNGNEITTSVGPSTPVEILGLSGLPRAGDEILVVPDEKTAREIASRRQSKSRENKLAKQQATKLQNAMDQLSEGETATLSIMVKADVHGSAEAITESLVSLASEEVRVNIISSGVGGITETDVNLALASEAIIIGFNVRADAAARKLAHEETLEIRYYSVIYNLVDDIKAAMTGMLSPELREQVIGIAEVKDVFHSSKFDDIAGCIVSTGVIRKSSPIRVLRDNVVVYEGELESLRRFKDDVNEVKSGTECGIGVKDYNDVQPGDQIEVFERIEVSRQTVAD